MTTTGRSRPCPAGPVPSGRRHTRGRTEKDSCRVMVTYKHDASWQVLPSS